MKTFNRLALSATLLIIGAGNLPAQVPDQAEAPPLSINAAGTHGDVILDGDAQIPQAGVLLRARNSRPNVAAQTATATDASAFVIFNSANTELLRVRGDGNVGIGTAAPRSVLHLSRNAGGTLGPELLLENNAGSIWDASAVTFSANLAARAQIRSVVQPDSAAGTLEFRTGLWTPAERMRITGSGRVGIGIDAPHALLHVHGSTPAVRIETGTSWPYGIVFRDVQGVQPWGSGVLMEMLGNSEIRVGGLEIGRGSTPIIQTTGNMPLHLNYDTAQNVVVGHPNHANTGLVVSSHGPSSFAGEVSVAGAVNVGGDMTLAGNLTVDGDVNVKYQDLAEWVPSDSDLAPGTVVVLHPQRMNTVTIARKPYDTSVAGVVSPRPGLVLGDAGDAKEMIATTGRVRVKVDATKDSIAIGDLLVTSANPGVAMKSQPLTIGGRSLHQPGTLIGKALEPMPAGTGEILVLLSLQ